MNTHGLNPPVELTWHCFFRVGLYQCFDPYSIKRSRHQTSGTSIYEEMFVEPLAVKDGRVRVPTAPGLGVALTEEIIAKYS